MTGSRCDALTAPERRRAWIGATRRRNELINLAKHRNANGGRIDHPMFIFVMAQALASAPPGKYRVKNRIVTWHGLDRLSLAKTVLEAGIGQLGCDDDLIERALSRVNSGPAIGSDTAGRLLNLTAEERDLLSVRTMEAIDESRTDREARRSEERRLRDAERKRRARAGRCKPRVEWLAACLTASKPWEAMGVTRRTYERRVRAVAGLSAETYSGVAGLSVSQVCPQTHDNNGCADRPATAVADAAVGKSLQRSDSSLCPSDGADVAPRHEGLFDGRRPLSLDTIPAALATELDGQTSVLQNADLHRHVQIALGGGNLDLGRKIADALGRDQVDRLKEKVAADGLVSAADELTRAAHSARDLMKSKKTRGPSNVVA